MTIFQAALVACALSAPTATDETVLLDFGASWCGPCRQMQPIVERLAAQGYRVRPIDIDADPALAKRFQVTGVPTFVMLRDGREVGRIVGATGYEQLVGLFRSAGPGAPAVASNAASAAAAALPTLPTSMPEAAGTASSGIAPELIERLLRAGVRIEIHDDGGHSVGSGTIVDAREGEALVLTCGHIFRDSEGKGRITVDMHGAGAPQDVPARVVGYDLESDLGFISFRPGVAVTPVRVAPAGYQARTGQPVVSIGCNHGEDATARVSRVTTIDKFLGTPNLQVAGQPVQGRSGGGLFSAEGYVIGVCNAADPQDDEGLFAALPAIHAELNQLGLAKFCLPGEPIVAAAPPTLPERMPSFGSADAGQTIPTSSAAPAAPVVAASAATSASAAGLGDLSGGAEVVCIIRPLADPRAKSRVVVLDDAAPDFLAQLAEAKRRQDARHVTSYDVPRRNTAAPPAAASAATSTPSSAWRPQWKSAKK